MPENNDKLKGKVQFEPIENTNISKNYDKSISLPDGFVSSTLGNTDFGKSKYDDPTLDSEFVQSGDYQFARGEKQNPLVQIGAGILRATSKAAIEAVKTPGYLYSLGDWIASDKTLDKALDNTYLNALENLDDNVKETLPVYQSYKAGKGGILDNIASTSFWSSDGADGVGYLLGMIAPGAALKSLNMVGKLSKLGIGASNAANIELGTQTLLNTSIEALAEAKGVADRLKIEGVDPEKIASAAKETFYSNMGVLLIPNAIMNKNLLGRFNKDKSLLNDFRDATGKLINDPVSKKNLLKDYSKSILGSAVSEGLVEEGSQTSIENYEVNKALGKTNDSFIEGVANEYLNTLNTTEGLKSIVLGSVLGSIGGASGTYNERKNKENIKPILSDLIKNNFDGFSVDNDIYKRDENGIIEINNTTDQPIIDPSKTKDALINIINENKEAQQKDIAAINNDKTLHDYITNNQFTRFTIPFIQQGEVGLELLNEHLDNASNTPFLKNENTINNNVGIDFNENKYKQDLKTKAKDLFELYDNTTKIIEGLDFVKDLGKSNEKQFIPEYTNLIANKIFQENSKQLFYKEKLNELNQQITKYSSLLTADLPQNKLIRESYEKEVIGIQNLLEISKNAYNAVLDPKQHQIAFKNFIDNKNEEEKLNETPIPEEQPITKDNANIADEKLELNKNISSLLNVDNLNDFDNLYESIKNNLLLTKEDKQVINEKQKELNNVASDIFTKNLENIDIVENNETNTINKNDTNDNITDIDTSKDQEIVSNFLSTNTTNNETEENQNTLNNDSNDIIQEVISEKSINMRNNVVMMRLFDHYFDNNSFKFKRNSEGFPNLDNNSNLDINEINSIQEGNTINLKLINLNKEQLINFKEPKDFDGKHIGIYSNDKLIGFVQQPHNVLDSSQNKELSEQLRKDLISYRKSVISKLENNDIIEENIIHKGNGNLYTKLNEKNRIDTINNIINDSRDKDKINNLLIFAYSNGENIALPKLALSSRQLNEIEQSLAEFKNYGKRGQVFQVVKDLKDSYSVIPVYASLVNDSTINELFNSLDKYDNNSDPSDIAKELDNYIYTSISKESANLFITNKTGKVTFFINGENYSLDELKTNKTRINSFKDQLRTKRQNINVGNINSKSYQDKLKSRNTLISNVTTFNGEYFIQPYLEFSYNNLPNINNNLTEIDELGLKANQKNTDINPEESIEELIKKGNELFGVSEEDLLSSDEALSRSKDNTLLDKSEFNKWLNTNLPQLKLSDIQNIAELKLNINDAYGLFKDLTIHLFEGAGSKTGYHEAFHGVFRNMLNFNEKKSLILEAINKYETPTTEQLLGLNEGLSKKYSLEQLRYLYYEEKLADDFAEYTYNYNNKTYLEKLSDKIKSFFNKILSYFNYFTLNSNKIDALFYKVNTLQFKNKQTKSPKLENITIFNREFEVFNDDYAYSKDLKNIFSSVTEKTIVNSIGNKFIALYQDALDNNKTTRGLIIYSGILKNYENFIKSSVSNPKDYKKSDYELAVKIFNNYPKIIKEVNKFLSYRNITIKDNDIEFTDNFTQEEYGDDEVTTLQSQTTKGLDEWTSIDGLSSASTRLRLFLSSIPVLNEDKTTKKDIFGVDQYHDFNSLYRFIERNLTSLYNFEDQIEYLRELSANRNELNTVIQLLTVKPSNKTQEQFELLQNDFKTNFSKQQLAYTLVKFDTDSSTGTVKYRILDSNRRSLNKETLTEWENNLINPNRNTISEFNNEGVISTFGTTKAKKIYNEWIEMSKKPLIFKPLNELLLQVGIEYTPDTLNTLIKSNNAKFKQYITNVLRWYSSNIPLNEEISGKKALRSLVEYETTNVLNTFTSSFNDVENKNIFSIQLPSFASKKLAKLKSFNSEVFQNELNNYLKDPFYKNSNLLQELKDDLSFRLDEFNISFLDGLKDEKGESKGSKFTSMNSKDFMSMQIALFQNKLNNEQKIKGNKLAKYIYITPSDKSMSMLFDSKIYNVNLNEDLKSIKYNSEILGKFYNIFLQETNRIKHNLDIKNDLLTNKENSKYSLDQLLQYYHFTKDSWSKLKKYQDKQANGEILTNEEWDIITQLFDGQAYKINLFSEKFSKSIRPLIDPIINNSTIDNLETNLDTIRAEILLNIQKELNEEYKDTLNEMVEKGVIEHAVIKGEYLNKSLDITGDNINQQIHKLTVEFSLNSLLSNIEISNLLNGDIALYKPSDLQKRTYQSQSMITSNNFSNPIIKTIVVKDHEIALKKEDLVKLGFTEEESQYIEDNYNDINVTDAQVYILPELYKRIHVSRGTWGAEMQEAYDIIEGIKEGNIKSSLHVILGGIKPFYYGNRFDENLSIQRYEQVKCAMIPLFKGFVEFNPLLAEKRQEMENIGAEMLAHESSFKATIGYRDNITSDNYLVLDLDANNFGIQVDNPEHVLDTTNDSMRQLKMLLIGSIDKNKTYKGISGKTIIDNILNMEAANIIDSMNELNKKLDVKTNINFSQFVKDMVTSRGATNNIEELLSIKNGEFVYPLDNGNLSTQIENLISSMYTNNVIKQAFEGGSAVQATSLGIKFRNFEEQQENLTKEAKLLQQELKWIKPDSEGNIEYAECIMPAWTSEFFNSEGKLIDINSIPDELKQIITYRIPTEGLHSMMPIKVVKFLPPTMGNFILLPYEVTKQMGADFDFDKLYFITKEFYKEKGEFKEYKYTDSNEEQDILERYNQYFNYQKKNHKDYITIDAFKELPIEQQNIRSARNNKIIDNYSTLLTAIENLKLLVKPSGFEKMKNIKMKYFRTFQKNNFFSSKTQRDYKDRNHTGISLKGQWALHVSGHSYSTLLPLNTEHFTENGFLDKTKTVNFNNINATEFNKLYDTEGNLISDEVASILAGVLDDIKDPLLAPLNINKYTSDVMATIMRSGFTIDTAIKFIAQDSLRELSKNLDANNAKIKEVGQGWNSIQNVINQYESLLIEKLTEIDAEISENPVFKQTIELSNAQSSNINDEELEYYIDDYTKIRNKTIEDEVKYLAFQIRILKNFNNYTAIAKELTEINKFFAINKQVGPNIENIIGKKELLNNIENSIIINGFDLNLIKPLKEVYNTHINTLDFFSKYFPYSTEYYNDIKTSIYKLQTNKTLNQVPIDDRNTINSFIRFYTDNYFNKFANLSEKYQLLFVNLPKFLDDIKNPLKTEQKLNNITYDVIRNNLFIQSIRNNYDKKNNINFITLKGNKLDLQAKNNIIESFNSLYNNSNTKQLALDLIDYSFVSSGFYTGVNNYASLINPEILAELGYMDFRKQLINSFNQNEVLLEDESKDRMIDQLIRNNPKPFTKVFDSEMFTVDNTKPLPTLITTSEQLIGLSNRSLDMMLNNGNLPRYIRVYDKAVKKALLYKNIQDSMSFEYITNLGKKGYMIEVNPEEDINNSFLKENNIKENINYTNNDIKEDYEEETEKPTLESNEYQELTSEEDSSLNEQLPKGIQEDKNKDNNLPTLENPCE